MIIDTDVGFDDLLAILFLMASGQKIEAFTTVNGIADPQTGAATLLRMQELLAAPNPVANPIPVYIGLSDQPNSFPEEWRNQASILNWGSPQTLKPQTTPAVEFLQGVFTQNQRAVQLLTIGPLTNIAAAIQPTPVCPISAFTMGGAIAVQGNLPTTNPVAEANMYVDPDAAGQVFTFFSGFPTFGDCLVPLDACNDVPVTNELVDAFVKTANPSIHCQLATQILQQIQTQFIASGYYAYDPLAAVSSLDPTVLKTKAGAILVGPEGQTTISSGDPGQQLVALGADAGQFTDDFTAAFGVTMATAAGY
jgi:inosine-uridine nucleoside N-ribohydrolase